jgi:hypothetical protein
MAQVLVLVLVLMLELELAVLTLVVVLVFSPVGLVTLLRAETNAFMHAWRPAPCLSTSSCESSLVVQLLHVLVHHQPRMGAALPVGCTG